MDSRREIVRDLIIERERRAREIHEKEQGFAGRGKRTSTLHREADFTLESPGGRVSPILPTSRPPPLATRTAGEASSKTDMNVRYVYTKENAGRLLRGETVQQKQTPEPIMGEFERRLLNAKKLGKAPMPSVEAIPWYHPSISRHIAESLLMHRDICSGTYLLRNSTSSDESLTLSVRCRTALRHYRVQWDGHQFCFGLGKFPDVASFEEHFKQQPMISGDCSVLVKLTHPYPRGVVEPHDYQEAKEVSMAALEATMELTQLTTPSLAVNSKEGFLTKLGYHRKNWKLRWFTLFRNELKYFNNKEDKTALRSIDLNEATSVEKDDTMGKPYCFRLQLPYRTFYMIACDDAEVEDWIAVLRWRLNNKTR